SSRKRSNPFFGRTFIMWSMFGFLLSCDEQLPIGLDFVEKEPLHVFNLDTVTVKLSTVYLDSVATHNSGRLLVGYHEDSLLGISAAWPYFLVGNDSLTTTPSTNYSTFDEAVFRLYYDGYCFYDTTRQVTLNLYLLHNILEVD